MTREPRGPLHGRAVSFFSCYQFLNWAGVDQKKATYLTSQAVSVTSAHDILDTNGLTQTTIRDLDGCA